MGGEITRPDLAGLGTEAGEVVLRQPDAPAGHRRRCGKRRRLDAVGNHLVFRAVQRLDAGDSDGRAARPGDLRAHRAQKLR